MFDCYGECYVKVSKGKMFQQWALIVNDGILRTGGAWQVITDSGEYSNVIRR